MSLNTAVKVSTAFHATIFHGILPYFFPAVATLYLL